MKNNNEIQSRFAILKYLNKLVTPLLHYVDISLFMDENQNNIIFDSFNNNNNLILNILKITNITTNKKNIKFDIDINKKNIKNIDLLSLSSKIQILRGLYFMNTKKSVFDALLASYFISSKTSKPKIHINRIIASRAKENPIKLDPNGIKSVFGQLFSELSRQNRKLSQLLRGKPAQQMFSVVFSGEGSIDVGGPYRECLLNAVQDLHSNATPLFILCPNGKNSVGLNREKWIINPSCTSSLALKMYYFIGCLMGLALTTKQTLSFDFPTLIWKQLLNEKIDISDLEAIDKLCVQALDELKKINSNNFEYCVFEKFTTHLSNGELIELLPNGSFIDVTHKNLQKFITLVIKKRLSESLLQINAIKEGLNSIISISMLSLFNHNDIEILVCGDPKIDIDILMRHTVYQGLSPSTPVVKYFWKTLHSFTQKERQLFLRFVWGRNRLPSSKSDWNESFTIKSLDISSESLPIAHTCFFSFDLPPYPSYKICREKIRFAIYNCTAIDIDFNPNSSSLQAWIDDF